MKRSLVALAALPLALTLAACEGPPEAGEVSTTQADQSLSQIPPGVRPLPTGTALIDFDNSPGGPVAAGTQIDSTYASMGVTFGCVVCSSGHAYALTAVPNNAVSLFAPPSLPFFDARFGAVKASFSSPRSWVSIEATAVLPPEWTTTPVAKPWLEAFDANGNIILQNGSNAAVYYPLNYGDAGYGTAQTLTVNASATQKIAYVLFSSQALGGTPVYGQFDNLRFNTELVRLLP
jgi:hypothetical protein